MRVLAVGDIHTKAQLIYSVAELIDKYDAIVFCGDYADDWNATPQDTMVTWSLLKTFQDNYPDKVKLVIGNHDYIYVNRTPRSAGGYNHITQLLLNSPESKELKDWLYNLPVIIEIDGVSYSHAGITDTWDKSENVESLWADDSPIWARPRNVHYKDIPQVFGHTPSETCWEVQPNVWCIDTFSTMPDGKPVGDGSILEIIDGKEFIKFPDPFEKV